ncbi:GNAT family N-acetyltransferase [Streptomyces sp. Ag109_O5-1]|uniref:GNAT family N-acetyltransferase n=1 Tax=Streptomyces sp. Ag109_O5-1 TaxID=1938851 RepID=UPI0021A3871C|nr:GNAT family N-acetyltransferase [Streptomyces sp. Ag109_O5-1]
MTHLQEAPDAVAGQAEAALRADSAVCAAGVTVRELAGHDELEAVSRLYDTIWRPDPTNPLMTTELLRALSKSGNYVVGAYDGQELVGASVAFFGAPPDGLLYSHIAGVSDRMRGRNVGFALKLHQRAWALLHGASTIQWTFDPLIRRNAHFNLAKLAASPAEYLPDFYGGMNDAINGGDESDRLLIRWHLQEPKVITASAGHGALFDVAAARAAGALVALDTSEDGRPVPGRQDAGTLLVAVPRDIEALRVSDRRTAKDWRLAVREVLGGLLNDGARVTGFDRAGWYLLTRDHSQHKHQEVDR